MELALELERPHPGGTVGEVVYSRLGWFIVGAIMTEGRFLISIDSLVKLPTPGCEEQFIACGSSSTTRH